MNQECIIATYPGGEYPLYIGTKLLSEHQLLHAQLNGNQVLIVTNETVAPLYLQPVCDIFQGYSCHTLILPDGEQYKTLETVNKIWDELALHDYHRDATLIALGGGVIGDMTGFAAACYHRGINFIQIPTTLLAQVDASIGGKTAVNHSKGKNLIGAFHQPNGVFINIDTLSSLPLREYHAGLAEIIKAALIMDAGFFEYLEQNLPKLLNRDPDILIKTITAACVIKRDIVAQDEKERGIRAWCNLGHTFGHAIEQNLGYGKMLHGEAVAIGIILAADLSVRCGLLQPKDLTRIQDILTQAQLPNRLPSNLKCDTLLATMRGDKKIKKNQLHLILLQAIGQAVITNTVSEQEILKVLQHYT